MMGSLTFTINGALPFCSLHYHRPLNYRPTTIVIQGLQEKGELKLLARRSRDHALRVLANPNIPIHPLLNLKVSRGKGSSNNEVIMVDPLEAKRLAAKQMQEIQAKERLIRRREIEAINGAWAMIGLTAGLVMEGQTGNGILAQLAGYWRTFVGFFIQ